MFKNWSTKFIVARAMGRELAHAIQTDRDLREAGYAGEAANDVRRAIKDMGREFDANEQETLSNAVAGSARGTLWGFRIRGGR